MNGPETNQMQLLLQKRVATLKSENQQLREMNHELQRMNLKMRLDLEVLAMHPGGTAAQKIIHRYRVKASILKEVIENLKN